MPHFNVKIKEEHLDRILRSYETATANVSSTGITDYWKKHRSLIRYRRISKDEILVEGESGFYFPGSSYSGPELLNIIEKSILFPHILGREEKTVSLPEPYGVGWFGRRVSFDFMRSLYHARSILHALPSSGTGPVKISRILEIGSGTGILAGVFKLLAPKSQYVLVDLPETLHLAALYLASIFPEKTFRFYGETEEKVDFVFLPNNEMGNVAAGSVDLAVNIDSMQEMKYSTINEYFSQIRRVLTGPRLFYQSNRESKPMGEEIIRVEAFPWKEDDRHYFMRENDFMRHSWVMVRRGGSLLGKHDVLLPSRRRRKHMHSLTRLS